MDYRLPLCIDMFLIFLAEVIKPDLILRQINLCFEPAFEIIQMAGIQITLKDALLHPHAEIQELARDRLLSSVIS